MIFLGLCVCRLVEKVYPEQIFILPYYIILTNQKINKNIVWRVYLFLSNHVLWIKNNVEFRPQVVVHEDKINSADHADTY